MMAGKNLMTKRNLLQAMIASILVSIPFTFVTFTMTSGSISDFVIHPGFWPIYAQAFVYILVATFLASVLTLVLVSRK